MMGRPTEAQKAAKAKDNGQAPAVELPPRLDFTPEELNLIHAILTQATFAESQAKIIAGNLQQKIEQFVGQ